MIIKSFSIDYEKLYNAFGVTLIYGENYYLKNEIVEKLSKVFNNHKFKIKLVEQDYLLKNIEILNNYMNQNNLFDENEVMIIRDVNDKLFNYIDLENIDKKIILLADNLPKNNKLRNITEKKLKNACIACYADDEKTLINLLRQGITSLNIKISNESINQLFDINKLNRNDINSGLEKLNLISKEKKIDDEMLSTLFNTTSSFDAFEISNNLLSGNKKELNKILSSFYHFSTSFSEIIGPLKYKINKLINIFEYNANERKVSLLIENYKPTIFWKEKKIIEVQLTRWSLEELHQLLEKVNQVEIHCKLNFDIAETIFNKFLLDIVTKRVLINTYFSQ